MSEKQKEKLKEILQDVIPPDDERWRKNQLKIVVANMAKPFEEDHPKAHFQATFYLGLGAHIEVGEEDVVFTFQFEEDGSVDNDEVEKEVE